MERKKELNMPHYIYKKYDWLDRATEDMGIYLVSGERRSDIGRYILEMVEQTYYVTYVDARGGGYNPRTELYKEYILREFETVDGNPLTLP